MNQLMFPITQAQDAFNRYVDVIAARKLQYNPELADEVKERLEFLFFSILEITKLAATHMEKHSERMEKLSRGTVDPSLFSDSQPLFFRIKFYTEALYTHAFRVMDILRHKSQPLPGLSGFKAPGVRDVRNHLLVHPEGGSSKIFSQSFQWGPETGSIIKPRRSQEEIGRHNDLGLVHNMSEFLGNFTNTVLSAAECYAA